MIHHRSFIYRGFRPFDLQKKNISHKKLNQVIVKGHEIMLYGYLIQINLIEAVLCFVSTGGYC